MSAIIQQSIHSELDKTEQLKKGKTGLHRDAWLGNQMIVPEKGRAIPQNKMSEHSNMIGGTIRMYRPPTKDILTDNCLDTSLKNLKGHGPNDQRYSKVSSPSLRILPHADAYHEVDPNSTPCDT